MSRAEAAKFLGVSVAFLAVDAVNNRHRVPYFKIGRRCVYDRQKLEAWLANRAVNAADLNERRQERAAELNREGVKRYWDKNRETVLGKRRQTRTLKMILNYEKARGDDLQKG
jgi:hypothetical protein